MNNEQNIETARQMYQAFGSGDVQAILDLVTDDIDWSTDAAIPSAPWYGRRHGKDGVASFFEAIGKTGPVTEFTPLAYAGNDQGDVMVFIRYAFTVTATGKHAEMNMHHYWKFRDGKVCYVRSSEDTAQVAAATPGGVYLNVGTGNIQMDKVYRSLMERAERREFESSQRMKYEEGFQVFLGIALTLLLLEGLISERKRV